MTLPASIRRDPTTLPLRLPSLVIAARRVAQTVRHGVHGRRRAGSGETFWQFRPFLSGEPSSRVDWRRSAREERSVVREREWEAAHTVWIWFDRSASMQFASSLAPVSKIDRAALLALAFADLCVRGGERAGLLGLTRPLATQGVIERFAEAIATDERLRGPPRTALPPALPAAPRSMVLVIGDFLSEPEDVARAIRAVSAEGAIGELVMIVDPIEEIYPFSGNTEFLHPAGSLSVLTPRAQNLREAYLARLAAHREAIRGICARSGWGMSIHRTDGSPAEILLALRMRLSAPESGADLRSAQAMFGLPLAFAAPAVLAAFGGRVGLYFLLRVTPPSPRQAIFPPLRLLIGLDPNETTPARMPWPILALRLAIGALIILAMAEPLWNSLAALSGSGPLLILIDDGFAAAPT